MAGWTCKDRELICWDGTICADFFQGDGSRLTGITAGGGAGYTWASNANYTWPVNISHTVSAASIISPVISGALLYGDGSNLTGIAAGGGGYTWTSDAIYTSPVNKAHVVSAAGLISTDAVSGAFIFGDGSNLTNLPAGGGGGYTWVSDAIFTSPANPAHIVSAAGFQTGGTVSGAEYEGIRLDHIGDPTNDKTINLGTQTLVWRFNNPASNPMEIEATGGYTGSLLHLHQNGGNPGSTYLLELESDDNDVEHIKSTGPVTTTEVLCTYVTGDSEERFILRTEGIMQWADGTNGPDVELKRSEAGTLEVSGALMVSGALLTDGLINGEDISEVSAATVLNTADISVVSAALYEGTSSAITDHVALTDEHLNWKNSVGTIHADNYTDTNTTYTAGDDLDETSEVFSLNAGVSSAIATNTTHRGDSSDPHGATLTQTNINLSGHASCATLSGGLMQAGDSISGAIVNVYSGTSATPPTANTTPLGSLYVQYTA